MSTDPELTPAESETTSKASSSLSKNPTQTKINYSPSRIDSRDSANAGPAESETTSSFPSKNPTQITRSSFHSKIDSSNDANAGLKKISCLKKITKLFPKRGRESQPKPSVAIENPATSPEGAALIFIKLIKADIDDIKKGADKADMDIKNGADWLMRYHEKLKKLLTDIEEEFAYLKGDKNVEDLRELHKALSKLKLQIPSNYLVDAVALENFQIPSKSKQSISKESLGKMPRVHKNAIFESSTEFQDFEALYNELTPEVKLCLLCFSVFPENAIIKKRLMVQWWVAEGFASEEDASKYIRILMKKGFIEPVNESRVPSVGCYRMHPFYRSVLATLAERANFFNFNVDGKPTQKFEGSFRACLVGEGLISYEDLIESGSVKVADLEKIHLLINLNEPILDFKPDWFSKMRNVNVLYLGRWTVLATDHIEVEDNNNFLDGFKNMNHMRFLSLQGVSNIITLPKSILMLENLQILDLRACHNLEDIPNKIGFLKSLTHLDMSECYLLDRMPKSLSSLTHLRVFKGFVVGENHGKTSCTLDDLFKLPNLTKLCIYTGLKKFPTKNHVTALSKLEALRKLTIEWGRDALQQETEHHANSSDGKEFLAELPSELEKLDLKCFPQSTTPSCLSFKNLMQLTKLKKLYIRGGKFSDLGQYQDFDNVEQFNTWKVQVLRLKYLSDIKMEWKQLQELFPDLRYLEQVRCPKLTLFPCDDNGIWTHPTKWEEFQKDQFNV